MLAVVPALVVSPALPEAGVVGVPTASAHSVLVSSTPADGQTVDASPSEVTATFNEDISPEFAYLTVMRDGTDHASGEPHVDGRTVSVAVPELEPGDYTVGYRIVSADGHPVQGSVSFTIAGATQAAASPTAESTTASGSPAASGNPAATAATAAAPTDTTANITETADATAGGNIGFGGAIAFLAVVVVALIGGALLLLRRQKKLNKQYGDDLS